MLTSKSVQDCRLRADAPAVIRAVKTSGLTSGRIAPGDFTVKASGRSTIYQPTPRKRRRRHR